jgi:hypothetical protein
MNQLKKNTKNMGKLRDKCNFSPVFPPKHTFIYSWSNFKYFLRQVQHEIRYLN